MSCTFRRVPILQQHTTDDASFEFLVQYNGRRSVSIACATRTGEHELRDALQTHGSDACSEELRISSFTPSSLRVLCASGFQRDDPSMQGCIKTCRSH